MSSIPVSNFGTIDFSPVAFEGDEGVQGVTPKRGGPGPSGDVQLWGPAIIMEPPLTAGSSGSGQPWEGPAIILEPPLTPEDQKTREMIQFRGTPLPLAEQMRAGLDPEKMDALINQCNNGQLSVNDLAAELMILMINNAFENKSIERQIRSEIAQLQFQNGMKIADMIKEKGELAYKKAVTDAVTKMVASLADAAINAAAYNKSQQKGENVGQTNMEAEGSANSKAGGFKYTGEQRDNINKAGKLGGDAVKTIIESTGSLICAEFDFKISKIETQKQATETMGKLLDSIASSVESSIRAQDQAIQFAMGMLDKINSLAHDSLSRIIGNMR
ncbi:MAG: hypothetical protein LBF34_02235 [Puniceicoccales bacterium]|jgi:hypothetical protein|nr:hypothetical protein [Puniceicoccales bacterium]